jgi:hypothetical protein
MQYRFSNYVINLDKNKISMTSYIHDNTPTPLGASGLGPIRKEFIGTRKHDPSHWRLVLSRTYIDEEGRTRFSTLRREDIARYYLVDNSPGLGARFVIFKDGHCEYTPFGSGLPVLGTEFGQLDRI